MPTKSQPAVGYRRKVPLADTKVRFESSLFDGEFILPSTDLMPIGLYVDLNDGNLSALFEWLTSNGVGLDAQEAIRSLNRVEFRTFREEWGNASGVDPTE